MRVLSKYFAREFLRLLVLCEAIFLFLYLIVDFLQKIDNFIEAGVRTSLMLVYFWYKAPLIMVQMFPAAALISVIIMFSSMKKRNEMTAIKACGLNVFKVSRVVILISFSLVIALFLFSEVIVPHTSFKSNEIWNVHVQKRDPGLFYGSDQIWYRGSDSIYWIRHFDYGKKTMESPTFYFFDSAFRLIKRIDGLRGVWEDNRWKIEKGVIQEAKGDGSYDLKKFDTYYLNLAESPETFVKGVRKPEEMSYWQLKRYAETVRREGYDNRRYVVDMNIKIAFPFISLVLVFIGIPVALGLKRGGNPLAVSVGMAICFLYVFTLGLSRSLGLSGVLPPLLAAWLANLFFLLLGIYLILHVER